MSGGIQVVFCMPGRPPFGTHGETMDGNEQMEG